MTPRAATLPSTSRLPFHPDPLHSLIPLGLDKIKNDIGREGVEIRI